MPFKKGHQIKHKHAPNEGFQKGHKFFEGGERGWFKKGLIPWNKGLKGFRAGEQSHLWKGGVTPLNRRIRKSLEYKIWREAVFARDNWTCIWCGLKSGNGKHVELQADHIKPFAYFPELRFAIDNGRTLCISCHKKTDTYMGRMKKIGKLLQP